MTLFLVEVILLLILSGTSSAQPAVTHCDALGCMSIREAEPEAEPEVLDLVHAPERGMYRERLEQSVLWEEWPRHGPWPEELRKEDFVAMVRKVGLAVSCRRSYCEVWSRRPPPDTMGFEREVVVMP